MARKCVLTGKTGNSANKVSHSNIKSKKRQHVNVHNKRFWWAEGNTWVRLKVSTRAMRTIDKRGLHAFAAESGVDLASYAI